MKMAPIMEALAAYPRHFQQLLVHTGQHYDEKMSAAFFGDLGLPRPDFELEVGSGSHAEQTGRVMMAFEKVCLEQRPDLVIVVGDVNSTMACAITAKKLGIKVAHVEAGLRSYDMSMPEEINRLCTDVLCDYLFTTDRIANENLIREGIPEERIYLVGNVMIDTLLKHVALARKLTLRHELALDSGDYATLTLHRPSNVDDRGALQGILEALHEIGKELPIIFPVHPRTRKKIAEFGLARFLGGEASPKGLRPIAPLPYLEFLHLNAGARMILTDSGGLQEESTVLGVPCLTLRTNTERPITCTEGTNQLVGADKARILAAARQVLSGGAPKGRAPEHWDGKAARRIATVLRDLAAPAAARQVS
jgi:UDP-N-acetylglucosamine 2-epimerase (non-hydrolysing)